MKLLIAMSLLFSASAHAYLYRTSIECDIQYGASCAQRTFDTFTKLGCYPERGSVRCFNPQDYHGTREAYDRNVEFCYITSHCVDPKVGLFSLSCDGSRLDRSNSVDLQDIEPLFELGTSRGNFRSPISQLCLTRD